MNEPKFTPGPWRIAGVYATHVNDGRGHTVCDVPLFSPSLAYAVPAEEAEANRRLIAAAPEMYALLERAVADWSENSAGSLVERMIEVRREFDALRERINA